MEREAPEHRIGPAAVSYDLPSWDRRRVRHDLLHEAGGGDACGCLDVARSIYTGPWDGTGPGELWKLREAAGVRAWEKSRGIASARDLAELGFKVRRGIGPGGSMRGRGGRRRAFREWLADLCRREGVTEPEGRTGGRPGLLEAATCPWDPDVAAALGDLEAWLDHLRAARRRECAGSHRHVRRALGPIGRVAEEHRRRLREGDVPDARREALRRRLDAAERRLSQWYFGDALRMAGTARYLVAALADDRSEWVRRRGAAARRLASTLTGGRLSPRQLYHLTRSA